MNDSRDNLSTADLAGQTAARSPERDGYDEPDRSETESYRADTSAGVADDGAGSIGDPGHDDPDRADRDGDATGATRADHDLDTASPTATDYDRDRNSPTGTDYTQDTSAPAGTGYDRDANDPDQSFAADRHTDDAGVDRTVDSGDVPVRTDVPPAPTSTVDTSRSTVESTTGPLLGSDAAEGFRARWTDVQTGFVDAPREAVQKADALVAELMQHLAATFADERGKLEHQWDRGDDVPTDDLRDAFQHYRSFFERLLSA